MALFKRKRPDYDLSGELEFAEYAPQLRLQKPRLRPDATVVEQTFRGRTYYVLKDPVSLQFYRVADTEREVIDRLDGEHTLDDIQQHLEQKFGAEAPAFRELARFVLMLRHANLTAPDESEDLSWSVKRAHKKRMDRLKQRASSFMYMTIPILDPERFLNATMPYLRWAFTKPFFFVWLATVLSGAFMMVYNFPELAQQANGILEPTKLPLLYVAFVFIKTLHELGHAYAVKVRGGEVHRMGIMMLIFTPCFYVDATPIWEFKGRWPKVLVGCAGMMAELFFATFALFAWLNVEPGTLRTLLFNAVFIASVSTLLFNGNPLLRYDAYYILSDLLEIVNLRQRSTQYLQYLAKRYLIGERLPPSTDPPDERFHFVWYGIAATCYRFFIMTMIILFVASKLFFVGVAMALIMSALWVLTPVVKMVKYIFFDPATRPVRARAVIVFAAGLLLAVILLGGIPFPNAVRAPCAIEPREMDYLRAAEPGFVREVYVRDGDVVKEGQVLAVLFNEDLEYRMRIKRYDIARAQARLRKLEMEHMASAQAIAYQLGVFQQDLAELVQRHAKLTFRAPFDGQVIAPKLERIQGIFLQAGDPLFVVASLGEYRVTAVVSTEDVVALKEAGHVKVRVKLRSAPGRVCLGRIERLHPAATHAAPPQGLANRAGGPVLLDPQATPQQPRTLFPWYRVDIVLDEGQLITNMGATGQVRFVVGSEPLGAQIWLRFRRLLHRRFLI